MSERTRLPRKAASTATYVYDNPSDEEEQVNESGTDEDEAGSKRTKGKGKAAPKRRKIAVEESDSEEEEEESGEEDDDDEGIDEESKDGKEKEIEYDVPRVDFSKVLPYEIIVEILSYLSPASLYALCQLNKSFHAVLNSNSVKQLWRKLIEQAGGKLPKLGGEEVDPKKLCAIWCEKECEFCGKSPVQCGDRYLLLRLCVSCRKANWTLATDPATQRTFADLHPATLQCVVATTLPPESAIASRNNKQPYYYLPDVHLVNEELLQLQLGDDAAAENPFAAEPEQQDVQKSLEEVRRLKRRYRQRDRAAEMEKQLVAKYSPRVKEYVLERMAVLKERAKLADWIFVYRRSFHTGFSSTRSINGELRRQAIEAKVGEDAVFDEADMTVLENNPLILKDEPLTHAIWEQIKDAVYAKIGKQVAFNIFWQRPRNATRKSLLKKPKSRSVEAWSYIEPALRKLYKKHKAEQKVVKQKKVGESKRLEKEPFFRARWSKIVAIYSNERIPSYVPRYGDFLALPSVKALYLDPAFGIKGEDDANDMKRWAEHFDDITEQVDDYILSLRLHALKLILAVTTEMTEEELDDLDPDILADETEYGDDFFLSPSSWLYCGDCDYFDSLVNVLEHVHKAHPIDRLPVEPDSPASTKSTVKEDKPDSKQDESPTPDQDKAAASTSEHKPDSSPTLPSFPIDLPLEVAVAFSAILELADLDENSSEVRIKDLKDAFQDQKLVWENVPDGRKKKRQEKWQSLLDEVRLVARELAKKDAVMPVPTFALKNLNFRERWKKQRDAMWGRR